MPQDDVPAMDEAVLPSTNSSTVSLQHIRSLESMSSRSSSNSSTANAPNAGADIISDRFRLYVDMPPPLEPLPFVSKEPMLDDLLVSFCGYLRMK